MNRSSVNFDFYGFLSYKKEFYIEIFFETIF